MKQTITARIEIGRSDDNPDCLDNFMIPIPTYRKLYWFAKSVPSSDFHRGFDLMIWNSCLDKLRKGAETKFRLHGMDYIGESILSRRFDKLTR